MRARRRLDAILRPSPGDFCAQAHVSRETYDGLAIYEELLARWQVSLNLVSPATLPQLWTRHFADSAQLPPLAPHALQWLDIGSGGGFPGLVAAIMLRERPGAAATLIDSDQRKCAFLRAVARETGAPARIICARIEDALPRLDRFDVVSARALAPLPKLVELAWPALDRDALGLFMTGEHDERLVDINIGAHKVRLEWTTSRTSPKSAIAQARRARP